MTDKTHWWEPVLADAQYAEQLREDYQHAAHMSDDELLTLYCSGRKYVTTWDHVGDAYSEYEELADAYLKQKDEIAHAIYEHYITCESEGLEWDGDIPEKPKDY